MSMNRSEKITKILDNEKPIGDALPFIFNGLEGPRYLDHVSNYHECDHVLMSLGLSANRLSRGSVKNDDRQFFIAH